MSSPKKNKTEKRLETLATKTREQKKTFLEQLPKYPVVQVACEKSGVGRSTYYAWRKSDKEFAKQADESIRSGELFINDMAESKLIQNIQNGNNTAIIFWLKNHHDSYNERIVHEHVIAEEEITEEKKAMAKALINIGLGNILKSYGINMTAEEYLEQSRKKDEERIKGLLAEEERKRKKEEPEELPSIHQIELPRIPRSKRTGANINDILRKRKRPDAM